MPSRTEFGHGLAKALGIQLEDTDESYNDVTRGESIFSNHTADTFFESEPTTSEWITSGVPSAGDVYEYAKSLFPFVSWIGFYNLQWLAGDLVAGITVGCVVIPQGMAYAELAQLPVQFGLYSSFMGVICYWFFATSKDITIGPVAVMSTLTGSVVEACTQKYPEYADQPWVIASALSVIAGCIILFIGLIRCGWIVELMPLVSLASFMTGSAINIGSGQVSTLLGIDSVNTRDSTYMVIINTLKALPETKLDAAIGLTALTLLYLLRYFLNHWGTKYPSKQKVFFFMATLRTVFVILLYTMISWACNLHNRTDPKWTILGTVPRGFQHAAVPTINSKIIGCFASQLPAAVIVLLIEHIAISKSFGRVNNYTINPSQEMVAIGVTNILGPFLGGYPATGSFTRTAINSKAGVRTPLGGLVSGILLLLAIYALPAVFFWVPKAVLAAVIIHAVGDLISPPQTVYKFWRVNPIEVFIFFAGVIIIMFTTIEDGIYATIILSFLVFMYRALRSKGRFLGKVKVHSVLGDHVIGDDERPAAVAAAYGTFGDVLNNPDPSQSPQTRNLFLPIGHGDGSNPELDVTSPYPGVFIYRFSESFNYPSASSTLEHLTTFVFAMTRRTEMSAYSRPGDRPWNDPGPKKGQSEDVQLPTLKAIILDFSSVNNVDVTSVQQLIDVRNQLDKYASPDGVDWHVACINNRWAKRALVSAGFGFPAERSDGRHMRWKSIFSVAEIGGETSAAAVAEVEANEEKMLQRTHSEAGKSHKTTKDTDDTKGTDEAAVADPDAIQESQVSSVTDLPGRSARAKQIETPRKRVAVHGLNRPLFHIDLTSALQSAIANVEARKEVESHGGSTIGLTP